MGMSEVNLFSGPGEMARLMRSLDWRASPLGDPDHWPRSLRVAIRILLGSGYPMYIAWGPEFIQFYNDAYRPILGRLKHPGALGSGTPQTFPELWTFIGPMFHRVLEEGQDTTLHRQALFLNRNGYLEECYYDLSYSPIPADDLGKVGGVLVTCTEVTNAVLDQRRLQTVRDLGAIHPQAHTAEAVCHAAAEVLAQNQLDFPFAAIYRMAPDGRSVTLAAVSGAAPGDPACPLVLPISNEAVWPVERALTASSLVHVSALSERFPSLPPGPWPEPPQEAALIPFTATSAQPVGFLLAGISARKQLDAAMEQFLVRCADAIGGRLANASAYEDARRRAESLAELDRAKTVFFSNISHEFRTPLTLIASPLDDLAASTTLSEGDQDRVALAQRNVARLHRLVNNLLDFSRIEAGRVNATFEPVDLASFTAELASGFQSTFEKAGITLSVHAAPIAEPIFVDRDMWEKIVLNLLSNAFKFTFTGGVSVSVIENAGTVEVRVADSGVGIPASELPRLFQRFHRIEGTRGRSYEGTGIGLALVQELVRIHDGTVSVVSQEGSGTQFTITLKKGSSHLDPRQVLHTPADRARPLRVEGFVSEALRWIDAPAEPVPADILPLQADAMDASEAHPSRKRYRVLVVDDNADMRHYLQRLLEQYFDVALASNGQTALRQIHAACPDLVLTDAMMPVMDGYGLLREIRATPAIASLPVIMVSARAGTEREIEGREAGADDYVSKPFAARELVTRIRSVLKIAEIRAASDAALKESDARSRQILERTSDAVFVLDRNWRFSYLNGNAVALIADRRDLLGKNVWEEFPDAVGTEFWRQYHRVMEEGVSVKFNEYYPHPLDRWFEVNAYPTEDGMAAFFRDVTAKLKAEEALLQSEKLAAVGRLASSIAHEINNPLEAITNLLYLMQADPSMTAETRGYLQTAQSEIARISHIATQTLRFHRQSNDLIPIRVSEVLDSVISLFTSRLASAEVSIERQYRSDSIVSGYPGELRQVFSNLLRNAIEAATGSHRIIVRERFATHPLTGEAGVRITFADSGSGISRSLQGRLFEPFFSTKPATGTGLGLWVSKQIIDKHRGTMHVRSATDAPRRGTVFSIFLPEDGSWHATGSNPPSADSRRSIY